MTFLFNNNMNTLIKKEIDIEYYYDSRHNTYHTCTTTSSVKLITKAIIIYDEENNVYTMYLKAMNGGPIISCETEDETIKIFKEAFKVTLCIKTLLNFKIK